MGKRSSNHGYRITEERARAWIVTAINPLLRALPIEEHYLSERLWTWRYHRGRCEVLSPCRDMVPALYADNWDDLLAKNKEVEKHASKHDRSLEKLVKLLKASQEALESDSSFIDGVNTALAKHRAAYPDDEAFRERETVDVGAQARIVGLLAEFAINNAHDPSGTSMDRFWRAFGGELVAFRDRQSASSFLTLADSAGDSMLNAVRRLMKVLREQRAGLCDEFGLPPTPIAADFHPRPSPEVF